MKNECIILLDLFSIKRFTEVSKYSFITKEQSEAESLNTGRRNIHFKLTGASYIRDDQGRPIPHVLPVEDPVIFSNYKLR